MAFITREYYSKLKKNKLIEHGDYIKLERMSRQVGLKDGNGIAAGTFRNALIKGFTTTDEVVELIHGYYAPKVEALKSIQKTVNEMKQKLAAV